MKTLVTKSARSPMKRMKKLLKKRLGRSARFAPTQPVFPTITHPHPHLFSALLLPDPRSPLRGLRGISPHHPRSRLLSPSKRMRKSNYPDPMSFILTVSVLVSCFSWFAQYILPCRATSPPLRQIHETIGCSLAVASYILQTDISFRPRRNKQRSVEVPLECFPPRFLSVLFDDVLRKG